MWKTLLEFYSTFEMSCLTSSAGTEALYTRVLIDLQVLLYVQARLCRGGTALRCHFSSVARSPLAFLIS